MSIDINYNEEPLMCITHEGKKYLRTGYCCQCGECCEQCPSLHWLESNVRAICLLRENPSCGQDIRGWPCIPEHINNWKKCTFKFEEII